MKTSNLIIPVIFLAAGFVAAYFIFNSSTDIKRLPSIDNDDLRTQVDNDLLNANPFVIKNITVKNNDNEARFVLLESELSTVKNQLKQIERTLQHLSNIADSGDKTVSSITLPASRNTVQSASSLPERLYSLENLINGGIDPATAEDIVRRKNNVELKRLELQDLASRENYLNTQRYYDELDKIDQQKVNLREELGENRYDEYLYVSKQSNRVMINTVMLGSSAEMTGIQKGDIIMTYDNKKMFAWQELKNATTEGELGDYVSISVLRSGQVFSYSVPRGPLGVQLGSARIRP